MKNLISAILIVIIFTSLEGCMNKGGQKKNSEPAADTSTVADTGFTGIKQYFSKNFLTYEAEFKNGVRQGLMKTYYQSGKLRQTFWYVNGMREDTAVWYHEDGVVFRKTAFKRDSMNGMQIQYYKSGKVRAKLDYVDGLRKPYLEEFKEDGRKVTDYPSVVVKTKDEYSLNGTYTINLELSKKDVKVTFYRGDYIDGLFVPNKLIRINNKKKTDNETTGQLQLVKGSGSGPGYVGIIAEINTSMGNKHLVYTKVTLPYSDLK
jgi:antitoxin component YwqK of YwqJK toxin-antitoxin module